MPKTGIVTAARSSARPGSLKAATMMAATRGPSAASTPARQRGNGVRHVLGGGEQRRRGGVAQALDRGDVPGLQAREVGHRRGGRGVGVGVDQGDDAILRLRCGGEAHRRPRMASGLPSMALSRSECCHAGQSGTRAAATPPRRRGSGPAGREHRDDVDGLPGRPERSRPASMWSRCSDISAPAASSSWSRMAAACRRARRAAAVGAEARRTCR